MKKIQQGFTLIELMIVVAIIGILAAVAIPAYQDYVVKAKLSKVQSTLDSVKLALAMYYQENGSFPNGSDVSTNPSASSGNGLLWNSIGIATGQKPTIPEEVETLTVDGTKLTSVFMSLKVKSGKIKATSIDGKVLVILGEAAGTAVTWSCVKPNGTTVTGATGLATVSTMTDPIALKYFQCI